MENIPPHNGNGENLPQVPCIHHYPPPPISPDYSLPPENQDLDHDHMVHYNNFRNNVPYISQVHPYHISEPAYNPLIPDALQGYGYIHVPSSPPPPSRPPPQGARRNMAFYQNENLILKTELEERTLELHDKNAIVAHIEKIMAAQQIDLAHYRVQQEQINVLQQQMAAKQTVLKMYETEINCLREKKKTLENVLASTEGVISNARDDVQPEYDLIDVLEIKKEAAEEKLEEITGFFKEFNNEFNAGVENLARVYGDLYMKIEHIKIEQVDTLVPESHREFLRRMGMKKYGGTPPDPSKLFWEVDLEKYEFRSNVLTLLGLVKDTFEDCTQQIKQAEVAKFAEPQVPKIRLRKISVSESESETEGSPASTHSRSSGEWSIVSPIEEVEILEATTGEDSEESDPPPPVLVPFDEEEEDSEDDATSVEMSTSKPNQVMVGRPLLHLDDLSDSTDQEEEESGKNYLLNKFLKHPDSILKGKNCHRRFKSRGSLRLHYLKDHKMPPRQLKAEFFRNNCCKFKNHRSPPFLSRRQ